MMYSQTHLLAFSFVRDLGCFPTRFVNRLMREHPGLVATVSPIPHDSGPDYGVRIVVPPPPGMDEPLIIEVADAEVCVAFDLWSMEYSADVVEFEPRTDDAAIGEAVGIIVGILEERLAIALGVRQDDRCVLAYTYAVDRFPPDDWDLRRCVRSWRGTYDHGWCLPWPVD